MDAVVIMAKVPRPNEVKTRLTPPLDPESSSRLYCSFLLDKLEQVNDLKGINPMIAYTPHESSDFFKSILPTGFSLIPQNGANLGERLANVSGCIFKQGFNKVVILDSDSPNLPSQYIYDSLACLDKADAVVGPCFDGGYYLIGFNSYMPELFHDIPWSSSRVTELTIEKAANCGKTILLLNEWYDVDTWEDLLRLKRDLERPLPGSFFCKNTYHNLKILKLNRG